jgi:hypothetical protein
MNILRGFSLRRIVFVLGVVIIGFSIGFLSHASNKIEQQLSSSSCNSTCVGHSGISLLKTESTIKENEDDKEPTPPLLWVQFAGYNTYIVYTIALGALYWFSQRNKILLTTHYKS